jgi:hypothetical protein
MRKKDLLAVGETFSTSICPRYLFLASINVKSPLSSSEYISNPCSFKESLSFNSLVLNDFDVSAIKRYPFFARLDCNKIKAMHSILTKGLHYLCFPTTKVSNLSSWR